MPAHEVVIGIDPGLKGCLVVLETSTGHLLDRLPMPTDILITSRWLQGVKDTFQTLIAAIEKPLMMRGRSSIQGSFTTGRNFGSVETAMRLLYIAYQVIPPQTWTGEMHKGSDGPGPKERSLCVARKLWPSEKFTYNEKQLKPQEGLVDAMLIAEFFRRRVK